jgi:hypothetical protein
MNFKIPNFIVPYRTNDNPSLFAWLTKYFGILSTTDLILFRKATIGDWNMDTTASVNVTYKNTNDVFAFKRILGVFATIYNDDFDKKYDCSNIKDGLDSIEIDDTDITITRTSGGFFDNANFDSTSIDTRGDLLICYTA